MLVAQIIMAQDGSRYRATVPSCCPKCQRTAAPMAYVLVSTPMPEAVCRNCDWIFSDAIPLPQIPDWPLPGQAPQYLSDDLATRVHEGDAMFFLSCQGDFGGFEVAGPYAAKEKDASLGSRLRNFFSDYNCAECMSGGWRAYLIQRKSPEEDA